MSETAAAIAGRPSALAQDELVPHTDDMTELRHVNAPPAETWNYLRINDINLEVEAPRSSGEVHARLPQLFGRVRTGIGRSAEAWIEARSGDARFVEVPAGVRREEPVVVRVARSEAQDVGVLVREGAIAHIVIVANDENDAEAVEANSATLVRVVAEQGSRVTISEFVTCNDTGRHLGGVGVTAGEGAEIELRQFALGGARVALGSAVELAGDRARLTHTMRYLVSEGALLDVNHVARQLGRATEADVRSSGVLFDRARKTVRETIDLAHGAKGAAGAESESVLIAGDDVVNRTLPTILCDEDDVSGTHGASIGSISPEQLAYLAMRGLNEPAAVALFERAAFDEAVLQAPEATSRDAALARAGGLLGVEMARDIADALGLGSATHGRMSTDAEEVPRC